jgi:hypothetical protein
MFTENIEKEPSRRRESGSTKKSRVIALFTAGVTDIDQIARLVNSRPSYVAGVLQSTGLLRGYFDLYTTTASDQNLYSRHFRNVLSFKNVEAAKESVARITRLYEYFGRIGDRAGQHHAQVIALTGLNRAKWSGKIEEARIFQQWLSSVTSL